jgi:DNA-binding MarR family transcriptional regulator
MRDLILDQLREAIDSAREALDRVAGLARVTEGAEGISLGSLARRLLDERRRRDACFPAGMFGEPAWDLLLTLFVAHEAGQQTFVTAALESASIAAGTGHRLLARLESQGLIVRRPAPGSGKKKLVELTPSAVEQLTDFLAGLV